MWGKSDTPETDKVLSTLWLLKTKDNEEAIDIACIILQYHKEETEYCIKARREAIVRLKEWGML
jgi:hypothetical protein